MYSRQKKKAAYRPWNKGKLMGQKSPLTPQEIWAIRIRLQNEGRFRDLALFNLAINSKLRASDLLRIRVSDVATDGKVHSRALISQQKTRQPVRFEITERTRTSIERWITAGNLVSSSYVLRAGYTPLHISPLGSTHGLWSLGCRASASILPATVLTRCAGRRQR